MIRVLHYIGGLDYGGSQTFVMELYRKIDRNKIQFDFITFPNEKNGYYKEIIDLGGKIYESPQYNGKNHFVFIKWWKNFFKKHKEYKILHGHIRSVSSLYIPIAKKAGLCTIIHSHSTSNGKGFQALIKDMMQYPVRYQADYLFACSEKAGKWLFGNKKFLVIPNAIDSKRFAYNEDIRSQIRKELDIENKYVIGTVGRLTEPKNHKFLIKVFARIYKENQNSILLIIGNGELKEDLKKQAKKLSIDNSVVFLGEKDNIQDYYQAMDCFALPSLWEGLGIVGIEAQCSGLLCIISDKVPSNIDMKIDLVKFIGLDNIELWVKELQGKNIDRKSRIKEIIMAGYDITENARKLQDFYLKISGRKN